MIDVSVIIVNWNTKDLLTKCINTIINKTSRIKVEIIVVDNASSDDSVLSIRENFPDVEVIENKTNLGFAKANNIGINVSGGTYVCLVNSDIELVDNVLDKLFDYMENNPRVGAVGPKTINADGSVRKNCRDFPNLRNAFNEALFLDKIFPNIKFFRGRSLKWFSHEKTRPVNVLSGCFLMVRRQIIEQIGPLDDQFFIYGEDVDWCRRIANANWINVFFAETAAIHFAGSSSARAPVKFLIERLKSTLQYWKKHHSFIENFIMYPILQVHYAIRLGIWSFLFITKSSEKANYLSSMKGYLALIIYLLFRKRVFC